MTFSPAHSSLLRTAALGAILCGCTATPGNGAPSTTTETTVTPSIAQPMTRVYSAATSGFTEPAELVLRDQAALDDAWRTLHSRLPGNPAPAVDLSTRMVVVVALGSRNTGGHGVRVDSVTSDGTRTTVHYTATAPGTSCMTTQMITSPVDIVSVARREGAVRFERRSVVQPC
ncbi:MAG: protease complex subunit PrcB family protein [Gemmatimonadota bacterium]